MSYFECGLSSDSSFLDSSVRTNYLAITGAIRKRMEKLEEALEISQMRGEDFAATAKVIFDNFPVLFENLDAAQLADEVVKHYDGEVRPERIEWPNADVVFDTAFVTREEWELMRSYGIGGSEAAIVQGISPFANAQELFYKKRGVNPAMDTDDPMRQGIFDRGHFVEPKVIEAFCKLKGATVHPETRMFRSFEYPAATANIDAIIEHEGELYVFEAKTTFTSNYGHWSSGQIPAYYLPQTHQYPAVLNDERIKGSYIGCLFTDDLVVGGVFCGANWSDKDFVSRFVPRNEDAEQSLLEEEQDFWDTFIATGTLPELSSKAVELETAQKYVTGYPDEDQAVQLPNSEELCALVQQYQKANDEYSACKKELDAKDEKRHELQAQLIKALGSNRKGILDPGGDRYVEITYKPPKDRVVTDLETLEVRYPEAYKDCVSLAPQSPRFALRAKAKYKGWEQKSLAV